MHDVTVWWTARPCFDGLDGRHLVVLLGALFLGGCLGVLGTHGLAGYWWRRARQLRTELRAAQRDLADYTAEEEATSRRLMAELRMPARRVAGLGPEAA